MQKVFAKITGAMLIATMLLMMLMSTLVGMAILAFLSCLILFGGLPPDLQWPPVLSALSRFCIISVVALVWWRLSVHCARYLEKDEQCKKIINRILNAWEFNSIEPTSES